MTKDELQRKMIQMITSLACCAPSLRENFWNRYSEMQIGDIQASIHQRVIEVVSKIENGDKDVPSIVRRIYSHEQLTTRGGSKLDVAINEMKKFFEQYIEFIHTNLKYHDSPVAVPYSGPIPMEEMQKYAKMDLKSYKEFAKNKSKEPYLPENYL